MWFFFNQGCEVRINVPHERWETMKRGQVIQLKLVRCESDKSRDSLGCLRGPRPQDLYFVHTSASLRFRSNKTHWSQWRFTSTFVHHVLRCSTIEQMFFIMQKEVTDHRSFLCVSPTTWDSLYVHPNRLWNSLHFIYCSHLGHILNSDAHCHVQHQNSQYITTSMYCVLCAGDRREVSSSKRELLCLKKAGWFCWSGLFCETFICLISFLWYQILCCLSLQ